MVIMEKGHYGQYTGNARHSRTPVTRGNYKASERDDAAHIDYLKRDIKYDAKHGGSDKQMTNDEKHISKLAGDMKYNKKHHSPFHKEDEKPLETYKGSEYDPDVEVEGEVVVTAERPGASGEIIEKNGVRYRKIGGNLFPIVS